MCLHFSWPLRQRRTVLLPELLGPMSASADPAFSDRSRSATTVRPSYDLVRPATTNSDDVDSDNIPRHSLFVFRVRFGLQLPVQSLLTSADIHRTNVPHPASH